MTGGVDIRESEDLFVCLLFNNDDYDDYDYCDVNNNDNNNNTTTTNNNNMYISMCVCACMYVCMCMCVCMHVYMYVCMYVCMHACIHVYTICIVVENSFINKQTKKTKTHTHTHTHTHTNTHTHTHTLEYISERSRISLVCEWIFHCYKIKQTKAMLLSVGKKVIWRRT